MGNITEFFEGQVVVSGKYDTSLIERQDATLQELFPWIHRQLHKERKYDFCNEQHRKDYNRRVKELVCL